MGRRLRAASSVVLALGLLAGAASARAMHCAAQVFEDRRFTVCQWDKPRAEPLEVYLNDERGEPFLSFDTLAHWLEARGRRLRWAMNAGMYHRDMSPVGWLASGAHGSVETVAPLNTDKGPGNFFLLPNGVFLLSQDGGAFVLSTAEAQAWRRPVALATQSGPLLVHRGQLHPALLPASTSRLVRNGVGVTATGGVWFAISDEPVNFHEFARLFRDALQCPDALYLDGNISSLYAPQLQRHDKHAVMGPILAVVERAAD